MRRRLSFALASAVLLLAACARVTGSGTMKTESREVGSFTSVQLAEVGNVQIEQGDSDSLWIEADDNVLPELTSEVSDGVLKLATKPRVDISPSRPITYHVTIRQLTGLGVSGSGTQTAMNIRTSSLRAEISGSGSVTVSGSADQQELTLSGSGHYQATGLATKTTRVQISGSGNADVMVSDSLSVQISGSGTLRYSGTPRVTQDVTGSGKIIKQ